MVTGIQFDVAATCQARGQVTINNPAGITPAKSEEIRELSDLITLLEIDTLLTELDANLSAIERFSNATAIKLSQALATAAGTTAAEKYFNALQGVCGNTQCSSLPSADRARALARINLLQAALAQLDELPLSPEMLDRLTEAEAQQTEVGVKQTLKAVEWLIAKLTEELGILPDEVNADGLSRMIAERCNAGVQETTPPVVPPPVITPPIVPPPAIPLGHSDVTIEYGLSVLPAYGFQVAGGNGENIEVGPALHDRAALALIFPGLVKSLQLDYQGLVNVSNEFTGRFSQDQAMLSLLFDLKQVDLVAQAGYLWLNDTINNNAEHLGSAGLGAALFDQLLYLYGGGVFGTTFGGYGGVRSSHSWQDYRLGLSGEIDYSYLNSSQISGTIGFTYSPVSFWYADLVFGLAATGVYNIDQQNASVNLGLLIALQGDLLTPQPLRPGGF